MNCSYKQTGLLLFVCVTLVPPPTELSEGSPTFELRTLCAEPGARVGMALRAAQRQPRPLPRSPLPRLAPGLRWLLAEPRAGELFLEGMGPQAVVQ